MAQPWPVGLGGQSVRLWTRGFGFASGQGHAPRHLAGRRRPGLGPGQGAWETTNPRASLPLSLKINENISSGADEQNKQKLITQCDFTPNDTSDDQIDYCAQCSHGKLRRGLRTVPALRPGSPQAQRHPHRLPGTEGSQQPPGSQPNALRATSGMCRRHCVPGHRGSLERTQETRLRSLICPPLPCPQDSHHPPANTDPSPPSRPNKAPAPEEEPSRTESQAAHPPTPPHMGGGPRQLPLLGRLPPSGSSAWEGPPFPSAGQLRLAQPRCALGHPALAIVSSPEQMQPPQEPGSGKEARVRRRAAFKADPPAPRRVQPSLRRGRSLAEGNSNLDSETGRGAWSLGPTNGKVPLRLREHLFHQSRGRCGKGRYEM